MRKQIPIEPKGLEPIGLEMTPERKAQFENDKARIEARKSAGEHSTHDLPAGDPGSDLRRHDGSPASAPRRNHLYPVEDAELTRKPPITEGYRAEAHFPEVAHTGRPRENAVRPQTRSDITQVHHVSESWVPDSESLERPSQGERIGEDPEPESSGQSWQKLIFADRPGWDQPEADDPTWEPKPKNAGSDPAGDRDASRDTPTKTDSIIGSDSDPKQGRRMDASEAEEHLAMAAADEDLDRALEEVGAKRTPSLTDRQVAQMEQALSQVRDRPRASEVLEADTTAEKEAVDPTYTEADSTELSPMSGDVPSTEQDLVVDEGMTASEAAWAVAAGIKVGVAAVERLGKDLGLETPEPEDVADAIELVQPWVGAQRDKYQDWREGRRYPHQ